MADLLLLTPTSRDVERDAVADAWESAGGEVLRLDRFWEPPTTVDPKTVRIYGPHTFALVLQEVLPIRLISPPDDVVLSLPARFLGREVRRANLEEVLNSTFPIFVKPLLSKVFAAGLHDSQESLLEETAGLPADTQVIWSEPVQFTAEARTFAVDGKALAFAIYEGAVDDEATPRRFANDALQALPFDGPLTLDIGFIPDNGWAVVECNEAWGSGLNGCDASAAIHVIAEATAAV